MSFELKFNEDDKCVVVGYADMIEEGEVVRIKRVDKYDEELPYLIKQINGSYDSWTEQSSLELLQNSIKKLS